MPYRQTAKIETVTAAAEKATEMARGTKEAPTATTETAKPTVPVSRLAVAELQHLVFLLPGERHVRRRGGGGPARQDQVLIAQGDLGLGLLTRNMYNVPPKCTQNIDISQNIT